MVGAKSRKGMASLHSLASFPLPTDRAEAGSTDGVDRQRGCLLIRLHNYNALRRLVGASGIREVMHQLAERVGVALPGAMVEPLGRDVVSVEFVSDRAEALSEALAMARRSGAAPMMIDGDTHELDLLLGGAIGAAAGDPTALIEEAEAALAEAQPPGTSPTPRSPIHDHADRSTVDAVDRALDAGHMVLHYQPKLHIRRQAIECVEALVRWQDPERGLVAPIDFIPAIERAQRMERLTLWVIERAIEDQRRLRLAGEAVRIFINISGHLLADAHFVRAACERIADAPDAQLGFEVTETSVIRDPEAAIAHLRQFDQIGVRVSIDDYGAGLSSLAYLKQLPACELKIDKLFITQLTSSNRDPLIVRSTIDLAHALDMEVVAEGVETAAALALLSVMGCDMVQGYLISRPVPLAALTTFLAAQRQHPATQDVRASFTRLAAGWKRG